MAYRGHPNKGADDYLSLYRTNASAVGKVLWTVALSLVVAWISVIERSYGETWQLIGAYEKLAMETKLKDDLGKKVSQEINSAEKIIGKETVVSKEYLKKNGTDDQINLLDWAENQQHALKENIKTIRSQINSDVKVSFFGSSLEISRLYISATWMLILAWLILYVNYRRRDLVALLAEANYQFRLSIVPPDKSGADIRLEDYAGEKPFWLAPLGTLSFHQQQWAKATLLDALGWSEKRHCFAHCLSICACLILLLIALRVLQIGFFVTDDARTAMLEFGMTPATHWLLSFILAAGFLVAVAGAFLWLVPRSLSSRRAYAGTAAGSHNRWGLAAWIGTTLLLDRTIGWPATESPTDSPLKMPLALKEGFYASGGDENGPVYYVDEDGMYVLPRSAATDAPSKLVRKDLDDANVVRRLFRGGSSYAIESAAIARLRAGRTNDAISLLRESANFELGKNPYKQPQSTRLLDLLATLYARQRNFVALTQLANEVSQAASVSPQGSRTNNMVQLKKRADAWTQPESKWLKVRMSSNATVKWHYNARKNAIRRDIAI